jgi:intracellular sulfur oxidation DsrE/DsrF family protein
MPIPRLARRESARRMMTAEGGAMTHEAVNASTLIMITSDGMGRGDDELSKKLLTTYLTLLVENGTAPGAICFYTDGVKLVVEGSPYLGLLAALEAQGVHLIICTTCLRHYGLFERVEVGVVGGMGDIMAAQQKAEKVITL